MMTVYFVRQNASLVWSPSPARLWPLLCAMFRSFSYIHFLSDSNQLLNKAKNFRKSKSTLSTFEQSIFFFHLEKSMTIPSILKTLLVLFEAISSKQCSTVSSFHYKGTKSMPLFFTRDQTNKQICILLLCILLVIHHSLQISYKLFYIKSGSSEIHVFVYRFHGNSDIKGNFNPF